MATIDLGKVKFNLTGDWNANTTYVKDDVVTHNNGMWICTSPIIGDGSESYAPGFLQKGYKNFKTVDWTEQEIINRDRNMHDGVPQVRRAKDTFVVKVADDGTGLQNVYWIDGQKTKNLTLVSGNTYRFIQDDATNEANPLAFSSTQDGTHNAGSADITVRYYLNGNEVAWPEYLIAFGTPGLFSEKVARSVEIDVDNTNSTFYMYNDQQPNYSGSASITVETGWAGYKYWDNISHSINFRGEWDSTTQYYYNDLVTYKGSLKKALKDTIGGSAPHQGIAVQARPTLLGADEDKRSWRNDWQDVLGGQGDLPEGAHVWGPNMGPIGWPYKHAFQSCSHPYRFKMTITKRGTVMSGTNGTNGSSGLNITQPTYMQEVTFPTPTHVETDTWNQQSGYNQEYFKRKFRHHSDVNPGIIQIEYGYGFTYYLDEIGQVFRSGYGSQGQDAGNFNNTTLVEWIQMPEDKPVIKMSIDCDQEDNTHTAFMLHEDGTVTLWGYNAYGQCGIGYSGQNQNVPFNMPKSHFNGQRIIDIASTGNSESTMFVRTENDEIWGWGRNNSGVLGQNNTTDYFQPVKIPFNAAANGGIKQFCVAGYSSNTCAYILDGNGYIWHAGYNGYGQAMGPDTTNHQAGFIKSLSAPNGDIVDMWPIHWNSYHTTFARKNDGTTWVAGYGAGGYYNTGTGVNQSETPPVQVPKINNLKLVRTFSTYSNTNMTMWLTDNGELFSKGYNNYSTNPNPYNGGTGTAEDGTYSPTHCYIPSGQKVKWFWIDGNYQSTNYFGPHPYLITEQGGLFHWGFSGYSTNGSNFLCGNHQWAYNSNPSGTMVQGGNVR